MWLPGAFCSYTSTFFACKDVTLRCFSDFSTVSRYTICPVVWLAHEIFKNLRLHLQMKMVALAQRNSRKSVGVKSRSFHHQMPSFIFALAFLFAPLIGSSVRTQVEEEGCMFGGNLVWFENKMKSWYESIEYLSSCWHGKPDCITLVL